MIAEAVYPPQKGDVESVGSDERDEKQMNAKVTEVSSA